MSSDPSPGGAGTWWSLLTARAPSAPAVVDDTGARDTEELFARAAGAATWLDGHGVGPGTTVPALLTTSFDAFALVVAGAGSARPIAPLGPRLTPRELAECLVRLRSPVLVTLPEHQPVAREVAAITGAAVAVVPRGGFPPRPPAWLGDAPTPDSPAFVLHTSGTSGTPKTVPVRQDRLALRVRANTDLVELGPGRLYASASTFHHIAGLGMFAVALGAGAAVYCLAGFSVEAWRQMGKVGVTNALLVPTMIERLLAEDALALPSLQLLHYGASPIHPDTLGRTMAALPGVRLLQIFGQTEGSPITALLPADHRAAADGRPELLTTVGRAAPGVDVRLEGADAAGIGEVCARAAHLFRTDADGWLRTGDLGRFDADGYLRLVGRTNDRIIRGGENVDPMEVEQILVRHPGVADVAVVGVPDLRWGEIVKAFVVPADPATPPAEEELRKAARADLAGYKVPTEWEMVAALPRSPQGKVLRRLLRDRATPA